MFSTATKIKMAARAMGLSSVDLANLESVLHSVTSSDLIGLFVPTVRSLDHAVELFEAGGELNPDSVRFFEKLVKTPQGRHAVAGIAMQFARRLPEEQRESLLKTLDKLAEAGKGTLFEGDFETAEHFLADGAIPQISAFISKKFPTETNLSAGGKVTCCPFCEETFVSY